MTYQETATGPGGTTQSTVQQVTVATAAAAAPAFTSQPTVSPSTGTAGTTYTATPGAVSNGTITSRAWSLNGSVISTGLTATPASGGTLTYQEFATGTGGSASSSVLTRTVSAAASTLVLSPNALSITSNAAAGTLVSNISNVPADVAPTVAPNDGRLIIAGDAASGWKVVIGMSTLSAGTINYTPPTYPGCIWTGAQMAAFVNILKPAMSAAGFGHVRVLVGDHNWHNLSGYTGANGGHLVRDVFAEVMAGDLVDGAAVHGYSTTGKNEFELVRTWSRNAKETHFTEMCLVGSLSNKVSLQQHLANAIIGGIRAGQNSVTFWNLFLRPLSGGRYQPFAPSYAQVAPCATISTDGNGTMVKRPEYMALVHLLKVMKPGARRCYSTTIGVGEASLEVQNVAFANRDGTTGVLLYNNADTTKSVSLIDGPSGLVSYLTLASGDIVSVNYTAPKGVPATGTVSAPGPVTGLSASSVSNTNTLAWTAPAAPDAGGLGGFLIKRGAAAGAATLVVGAAAAGETSFADIDVVAGTTYFYQVFALSAGGLSASSPEASVTTVGATTAVPGAPTIAVTPGNAQNVVVLSSAPADNGSAITSYNLYRSTTPGGQGTTPLVTGVTFPYTDTGLTNGTPYYYTASAVNGVGQGPKGVEQSGTPTVASANVKPGPGLLISDDTGGNAQTAKGAFPGSGWSNTSYTYTPATSASSNRNAVIGPDGVTQDASTQTFTNTGTTSGYASVECGTPTAVGSGTLTGSIWLRGKVGGELLELTLMADPHTNILKQNITLTTSWAKYTIVQPSPTAANKAVLGVGYRPNTFNGSMSFDSAWPNLTK